MDRKPRSQAQRDAQLNAMEAARGAAARRAEEKRRQAERDAADQSCVRFRGPRYADAFMPQFEARVIRRDGEYGPSKTSYDEAEVRAFAEYEARFTKRGVVEFDWDTGTFEAQS